MSAPNHRTGSCLCESIKFEIAGSPVFTNNCHCLTCQKSYAAVFASLAFYADSVSPASREKFGVGES